MIVTEATNARNSQPEGVRHRGFIATEEERRADMAYLSMSVDLSIIDVIGTSPTALSQVVSATGYPREEVACRLLDMKTRGLLDHFIKMTNGNAEATFCLTPKADDLLRQEVGFAPIANKLRFNPLGPVAANI